MREREGPQPQVTSGVGNTPQRKLDSLDALVDHNVHHGVFPLPLLLLVPLVLKLFVALWYGGVALQCITMYRTHAQSTRILIRLASLVELPECTQFKPFRAHH